MEKISFGGVQVVRNALLAALFGAVLSACGGGGGGGPTVMPATCTGANEMTDPNNPAQCICESGFTRNGSVCTANMATTCGANEMLDTSSNPARCVCQNSFNRNELNVCASTATAGTCRGANQIPAPGGGCMCDMRFGYTMIGGFCVQTTGGGLYGGDAAEYGRNLGVNAIQAAAAYAVGALGQSVTVAVVDSGMMTMHIDLRDNLVPGYYFGESTGQGTMVTDGDGHGTAVGGVVAAIANGTETHGIAPRAKLMPLQIADRTGSFNANPNANNQAFQHAVLTASIAILNNSFGSSGRLTVGYQSTRYVLQVAHRFDGTRIRMNSLDNDQSFKNNAQKISQQLLDGRPDFVMVWAAGNEGWNSIRGTVKLCNKTPANCGSGDFTVSFSRDDVIRGATRVGDGQKLENQFGAELFNAYANPQSRYPIHFALRNNAQQYIERGEISYLMNDPSAQLLLSRWLVAVAVESDGTNEITDFSNGCGDTKPWCLAAPGRNIRTTHNNGSHMNLSGTSFSAPHVSGALAVLKSNMSAMPVSVIAKILLSTATPRGVRVTNTAALDDTYGWGMLNLSAAIAMQNTVRLLNAQQSVIPLKGAEVNLPPQMKHIKPQLQNAAVAVGGIGDIYYNMPLADIAHVAPPAPNNFGDAAKDMLSDAKDNRVSAGLFFAATDPKTNQFQYAGAEFNAGPLGAWQIKNNFCNDCETSAWQEWDAWNETDAAAAPLFANAGDSTVLQMRGAGLRPFAATGGGDAPWQQFGFRWNKTFANFAVAAEMSEINESQSFMGANFGTLGRATGKSNEARFLLRGDLLTNLRGFAEYRQARGDADIGEGGFLSAADGLRAESWAAGLEWRNVLSGKIRLTAKRAATFTGGRAVLNHTEADGDFTRAFYAGVSGSEEYKKDAKQTLHARQTELDFGGGKTPMLFSLGYARELQNGGAFALGAEVSGQDAALSAQFRMEF